MALTLRKQQSLTIRERKMNTDAESLRHCWWKGRRGDPSEVGLGKIEQYDTCTTYLLSCGSSSRNLPGRCTPNSMKIHMHRVIHSSQVHNGNILEKALRPIPRKGVV